MVATTLTFEERSLADPDRHLELHRGQVREKPPIAFDHSDVRSELAFRLASQLDPRRYRVHIDGLRLRRSNGDVSIPDVVVIPSDLARPFRGRSNVLPVYDAPLPLVIEVWSPSTGGYDVDEKIPEYMVRGDEEI